MPEEVAISSYTIVGIFSYVIIQLLKFLFIDLNKRNNIFTEEDRKMLKEIYNIIAVRKEIEELSKKIIELKKEIER